MRVILTRHGETYHNAQKISMGQSVDGKLNERGLKETKELAECLKTERISFIYSSDLGRTIHTAKEILNFHPKARLILSPHLRERNLGVYEDRPSNEWREAAKKSPVPFHLFKPGQGESYEELQNRVSIFLDIILTKHKNDTLLIVSHTGTLTVLLLKILNRPLTKENYEMFKPKNTAITVLDYDDKKNFTINSINSITHLKTS